MPTIGDTLREGRMRQKLDIADVERQTKIRAKYLRALENEEFSMLPGPTFVKTFLRTYAELLGLDPHALVEEYRAHYEPRDELETLKPLGPPGPSGREHHRRPGPRPWMVLTLIALAVVAGLIVLGLSTDDNKGGKDHAAATDTQARTERAKKPKQRRRRAAATRVALRISPQTPTYACVDRGAGTQVIYEGTLEAPRTFHGARLRVNLGKSEVNLRANDKAVPIPRGPDPVGYEFTARSTRPIPVGERPCA
jgi:cytoskeleton protein RodZ